MKNICVKLRQQKSNEYRMMLASEKHIFPEFSPDNISQYPYSPETTLQDEDWFYIANASQKEFGIDLFSTPISTADLDSLAPDEFGKIDYLFVFDEHFIFFQNVSKTKLISKKIIYFGEKFTYNPHCTDIVIKDLSDAIYHKDSDTLYFRKLESITRIFKGIDMLYREATQEETESFLANDFITLTNDYSSSKVKTANRKRIALAAKTLSELGDADRNNIFSYIGEYCPELQASENTFKIGSENELKLLLYGIEQRFYTTTVGGEKRLANSIITLNQNQRTP